MTDFPSSTETESLNRLRELIADSDVQCWPEKVDGGFMKLIEMRNLLTAIMPHLGLAQPAPEAIQEVAANAIRAFCQNLGANTIVVTGGVERIYYSGLSLDALAVAVALALSSPHHEASK